jgi:hypothetical protein
MIELCGSSTPNVTRVLIVHEELAPPAGTHLADKTGALKPLPGKGRYDALQWLFVQVTMRVGPIVCQLVHLERYASRPSRRFAMLAWTPNLSSRRDGKSENEFANLLRWRDAIALRPGDKRALAAQDALRNQSSRPDEADPVMLNGIFGR